MRGPHSTCCWWGACGADTAGGVTPCRVPCSKVSGGGCQQPVVLRCPLLRAPGAVLQASRATAAGMWPTPRGCACMLWSTRRMTTQSGSCLARAGSWRWRATKTELGEGGGSWGAWLHPLALCACMWSLWPGCMGAPRKPINHSYELVD